MSETVINCPVPTDRKVEKLRGCLYTVIEVELLREEDAEIIYKMLRECDKTYSETCYYGVINELRKRNIEIDITVIAEEERKILSEIFQ